MTRPYRPSNGTEGELFCEEWCYLCIHEVECEILTRTFIHDINDPEYPKEWIQDDDGPQCTAFEEAPP